MNTSLFFYVLPFLLKGMLGIFLVTVVLILCICLLNRFFPDGDQSPSAMR